MAAARKAEAIAAIIKRILVQACDHNHVSSDSWQPAMNGNDAVVVVDVEHVDAFATQRRMLPSEPHELAREAMLIRHMFIFAFETVPPNQQLGSTRPVRPV